MSSNETQPGLISGHAQYAKGVVNETVGSVTGAETWSNSGAEQKAAGIQEMKDAGEQRKSGQQGMGKAEELAGKAVGCEGMENEGAQSKTS